jgi:hypothetical protein
MDFFSPADRAAVCRRAVAEGAKLKREERSGVLEEQVAA